MPPTALGSGVPHATQIDVHQPFNQYGGEYSFGDMAESHLIPVPSLHGSKGCSFPALVPPDDRVKSKAVVGLKPGDSNVVIDYQVDEFTHTCHAECFVAQSQMLLQIYRQAVYLSQFPTWN